MKSWLSDALANSKVKCESGPGLRDRHEEGAREHRSFLEYLLRRKQWLLGVSCV